MQSIPQILLGVTNLCCHASFNVDPDALHFCVSQAYAEVSCTWERKNFKINPKLESHFCNRWVIHLIEHAPQQGLGILFEHGRVAEKCLCCQRIFLLQFPCSVSKLFIVRRWQDALTILRPRQGLLVVEGAQLTSLLMNVLVGL